jgi:hypothetical protein
MISENRPATARAGRHRTPEAPLERASRVVVAAVDGEELLAEAGGLLQHLHAVGTQLEVLLAEGANVRAFARCGLRSVPLHRLGLRRPLPAGSDGDLLAALSEVIGFDPGPGLGILAPAELAGRPDRVVVRHAAAMAARVYGAEIAQSVPHGAAPGPSGYRLAQSEAARKRYAVGAAASPTESFLAEVRIPTPRVG